MKYQYIFLFIFLYVNIFAQSFKGIPTGKEDIASSNSAFEKEVLEIVNKERKKRMLKPLVWNTELSRAARYHAMDMAIDGYFDHQTKDRKKNGKMKNICDVFKRMDKFVDKSIFSRAENIAYGQKSPNEVMKDWMKSKGHRVNILDKEAKFLGVAYVEKSDSQGKTYWVQSFGM